MTKINRIIKKLLIYPHYKMNVFCGTNSFQELYTVFFKLFDKKNLLDGEDFVLYTEKIKTKIKSKNIFTFASGRMGLYSILKSIDIQKDDEVILPSYTCVVVPNAIIYSGAKPIYTDISKNDFNIDIEKIESLITNKTKVIYAQHTFGQMCDINKIIEIAKKYNLIVIEDAALALGAKCDGKYLGTIGDFGYFSTDRSKVINTGLGGFVSVNNEKYVEAFMNFYKNVPFLNFWFSKKIAISFILNLITLNPYFYWIGKLVNIVLVKIGVIKYFGDENQLVKPTSELYSYPSRLPSILSSIGISQLEKLESNLYNRKMIVKYYNSILNIYKNEYIDDEANIFLRYSFLIKNRDYWEKRFSNQIDLSIWFKTIASGRTENFQEIYYNEGTNSISEYVSEHIFNLPTHNKLKPKRFEKLLIELKESGDIIKKEDN